MTVGCHPFPPSKWVLGIRTLIIGLVQQAHDSQSYLSRHYHETCEHLFCWQNDFLSPDVVYEGVGGTGEKCRVQAAVSVCSVPSFRVCCPCLLHEAGADLAGTTSIVPPSPATPAPSLAALAAAQLCVVS